MYTVFRAGKRKTSITNRQEIRLCCLHGAVLLHVRCADALSENIATQLEHVQFTTAIFGENCHKIVHNRLFRGMTNYEQKDEMIE